MAGSKIWSKGHLMDYHSNLFAQDNSRRMTFMKTGFIYTQAALKHDIASQKPFKNKHKKAMAFHQKPNRTENLFLKKVANDGFLFE